MEVIATTAATATTAGRAFEHNAFEADLIACYPIVLAGIRSHLPARYAHLADDIMQDVVIHALTHTNLYYGNALRWLRKLAHWRRGNTLDAEHRYVLRTPHDYEMFRFLALGVSDPVRARSNDRAKWNQAQLAAGNCIHCGQPVCAENKLLCSKHRDLRNQHRNQRRKAHHEARRNKIQGEPK